MTLNRRTFLGGSLALAGASAAAQQWTDPRTVESDPDAPLWPPKERFPLWPGSPPGAPRTPIAPSWSMNGPPETRELWIRGVAIPEVHVFRPARPDGSALLVLPGGGYHFLSVQNEGLDAAQRFNASRTTAFVLTYRLPAEGWASRHMVALQDAQRAMRLIRSRAAELEIDPERLGVLGFSAGGHLAADLCVSFDERTYAGVDAADRLSARPAYAGLIYPVISLDTRISLGNSAPSLLGPDPSRQIVESRSPARRVAAGAPPSFVVAAFDDGLILADNSLQWIDVCRRAKVPVEAHLLSQGGHGFGFRLPSGNPGSRWPDLFAAWLRGNGG